MEQQQQAQQQLQQGEIGGTEAGMVAVAAAAGSKSEGASMAAAAAGAPMKLALHCGLSKYNPCPMTRIKKEEEEHISSLSKEIRNVINLRAFCSKF